MTSNADEFTTSCEELHAEVCDIHDRILKGQFKYSGGYQHRSEIDVCWTVPSDNVSRVESELANEIHVSSVDGLHLNGHAVTGNVRFELRGTTRKRARRLITTVNAVKQTSINDSEDESMKMRKIITNRFITVINKVHGADVYVAPVYGDDQRKTPGLWGVKSGWSKYDPDVPAYVQEIVESEWNDIQITSALSGLVLAFREFIRDLAGTMDGARSPIDIVRDYIESADVGWKKS